MAFQAPSPDPRAQRWPNPLNLAHEQMFRTVSRKISEIQPAANLPTEWVSHDSLPPARITCMRYRLRTLMILMALVPPGIAGSIRLYEALQPSLVHPGVHVNVTWKEGVQEAQKLSSFDSSR